MDSFYKSFVALGHHSGSKKRDNNTERSNGKTFCESLDTIFDLAAKNAEQQISGDRIRTEKAKKEEVSFLHDQRNAHKTQMSILDIDREKNAKENVKDSKLKISK